MNYQALKAKIATYASGTTDAAILADITSTTSASAVTVTSDVSARAIRDTLYARGSWDRVLQVLQGALSGASAAILAICRMLDDMVNGNDTFRLSVPGIESKIGTDLTLLQTTKMADAKGVLWAAGEFATGDPGDVSILASQLSTVTLSWADINGCAGVAESDLLAARIWPGVSAH